MGEIKTEELNRTLMKLFLNRFRIYSFIWKLLFHFILRCCDCVKMYFIFEINKLYTVE